MKDEHKTKKRLINELVEMRRRITELEKSETERKQADQALQNGEKRYRRLIQQSVEAIYMFDPATKRILEANPAFLDILGYTAEEVHTLTIYDFIAHNRESIDAYIQHILTFGGTTVGERVWRRKDRVLIDVRVNASKVRQRGRDIIFVVARDITERKQAEEATKLAYAELNQIFNTVADGMRLIDKDFKVLRVNETFWTLSGVSKDEALGKKCYEVFPGPLCHTPSCPLTRILGGEGRVECEVEKEHKDGTRVPCILTATPFWGLGGKLIGIVENFKDITERKRAEEALKESEEKYRSLVESSEDSIYLVDRNCKYLFMNNKHLSRLGLQMSQVKGITYGEFHSPEETEEFAKKIKEVLETGKSLWYEYRSERDNRYFIRTLSPVKDSKTRMLTAVTVISKDITERKKAETHLIQAAKMGTLGEMASGIAHELNQPLSVIKIGSDFLLKMIKKGEKIDDQELNIITQEMGTQVDRASDIINHLRIFARLSETVKGEIDINAPIRDVFKILGQQLKVHRIEVELDLNENLPSVMADHNRLEQVFINLVLNAMDAMDEKEKRLGKEKIEKILSIRSYLEDREIVVTVSDTGIGIPEKIMDRLFEPFFTTKQVGKGTGLGLSISYGIVKDYDGAIDVKSEEGIGTTLILRLPAYFTC